MPIPAAISSTCIGCHLTAGYEGGSAAPGAEELYPRGPRDASAAEAAADTAADSPRDRGGDHQMYWSTAESPSANQPDLSAVGF